MPGTRRMRCARVAAGDAAPGSRRGRRPRAGSVREALRLHENSRLRTTSRSRPRRRRGPVRFMVEESVAVRPRSGCSTAASSARLALQGPGGIALHDGRAHRLRLPRSSGGFRRPRAILRRGGCRPGGCRSSRRSGYTRCCAGDEASHPGCGSRPALRARSSRRSDRGGREIRDGAAFISRPMRDNSPSVNWLENLSLTRAASPACARPRPSIPPQRPARAVTQAACARAVDGARTGGWTVDVVQTSLEPADDRPRSLRMRPRPNVPSESDLDRD